jgi:hypothetical protein
MRWRRGLRAQNRQIALPDRRCRYATRRALNAQVIVLNNLYVVVCWACEYSGLREASVLDPHERRRWLNRLRYASIRVLLGPKKNPHEMGSKKGNVKIWRKVRRP